VWLPSASVMACSLLGRNSMRLINYSISTNLNQNKILQESWLLLIFMPCYFKSFDKVSSKLLKWFRKFILFSSKNPQLLFFLQNAGKETFQSENSKNSSISAQGRPGTQ
jgi:hypothetical protein